MIRIGQFLEYELYIPAVSIVGQKWYCLLFYVLIFFTFEVLFEDLFRLDALLRAASCAAASAFWCFASWEAISRPICSSTRKRVFVISYGVNSSGKCKRHTEGGRRVGILPLALAGLHRRRHTGSAPPLRPPPPPLSPPQWKPLPT